MAAVNSSWQETHAAVRSVYFTISFLVIVIVSGQNEGTLVVFAVFDVSDIVKKRQKGEKMVLRIVKKTRRQPEKALVYRAKNEEENWLRTVPSLFGLGGLGAGAPQ